MGKEEELKITKLSMLVELNNGNVHQLITTSENRDMYLEVIEQYEKGIKLIEAPLEDIEIKNKSDGNLRNTKFSTSSIRAIRFI